MSRIVVFGAGGRAGRTFIDEARSRGHEITAVVRDPGKYPDLAGDGVTVVAGDALDASKVAEVAAGHDVAVDAVNIPQGAPHTYFVDVTKALLAGLPKAGVGRVLIIGGAGSLEVAPGQRLVDTPDFHEAWKPVALAHADSLDYLRATDTEVDWVYVSPAAFFNPDGARTGTYRVGADRLLTAADGASTVSYADYAIALVDEIENPAHHNTRITVAD